MAFPKTPWHVARCRSREKFPPRTSPQSVVHKHLWIAVDMWRTPRSVPQVDTVGASCRDAVDENGKTRSIVRVEVRPTASYVANEGPMCRHPSTSFGEVRGTTMEVRRAFACASNRR